MKYSLLAFFFCLNLAVSAVETVTLPIPLFGSGTTGYRQGSTEIGGDKSEKLHFTLDPELLRRAVIKPEDLTLAKLTVAFIGVKGDVGKSELVLSSEDHVLGRIPLSGLKPGTISFDNLGDFARTLLKKQQEPLQMTLSVAGGEPTVKIQRPDLDAAMQMHPFSLGPTLQITIVAHPKTELFKFDVVPRPGVYAVVKDGHITYGGERLRLWGACRHPSQNLDTARRLRQMGFNGIRLWGPVNFYNPASGKDGSFKTDYRPDGSGVENFDRFFAEIKKQGCFIICPTLHYEELITKPDGRKWISTDDSFVSGGDDWEAWKEGISQIKDRDYRFFVYFDERLQKVRYKHTENFLNHVNPYTKKRYAEEEAIAVFEVYNENGYLKWSLEQGYAKWPAYFRNKLQKLWNEYLKKKYTDDSGLLAAWGKLDDGESLAKNSVKLGPIIGERTKYPEIRGNDYVTFNIGLIRDFNEKFVAYCRGFAPKGVGINVVPFVHDTYYRNCVPWGYVDSFGDVNSFGMYQSTLTSSLSIPPSLYIVDNNTLADKPNMIYEINTHRPMPTRAEFPYRVAALASYQDWDAVFWHYGDELTAEGDARFMKAQRIPDELFTIAPMRYMTKFSPDSAICHSNDPIMSASMATAGHIFRHNLLAPAEKPKVYVVGKRDIFSYNGFNGAMINKSTFREGSRIKFDDKGDFGFKTEDGSPLPGNLPAPSPFLTGKEQIYDWANSRMMLDTPTLKAYVGETKNLLPWRFKDGIAISNLNQPFVAWSVSSDDGKALTGENASRRLLISVLSDARNFGFDMDWSIALPGGGFVGPRIQAEKIRNKGRAPVVYNEVGFTLYLPRKISGTLRSYDFALREFATQKITNSAEITAPNGHAFCYRLDIDSFGEASATPASAVPQKVKANSTTSNNSDKTIVNAEQFWSPVSVINWSLDSETAHRYLRESTLLFSNIAPIKRLDDGGTQIIVNELEVLFGSPATLELRFDMHHRMRRLSLSNFPKAPSFESSVAALTKVLGKPFSSDVKPEAFAHNKVVWKQQHGNSVLTVTLSEFQAYMSLVAELKTEK